jgi:hypothetical protein
VDRYTTAIRSGGTKIVGSSSGIPH